MIKAKQINVQLVPPPPGNRVASWRLCVPAQAHHIDPTSPHTSNQPHVSRPHVLTHTEPSERRLDEKQLLY